MCNTKTLIWYQVQHQGWIVLRCNAQQSVRKGLRTLPLSRLRAAWFVWRFQLVVNSYICIYAHALVPKTPVPKCMQHSLQKNAHLYILTHICIRIHMHTHTRAHAWHCPHAEALILRHTIYAQICIHIHVHMCINA